VLQLVPLFVAFLLLESMLHTETHHATNDGPRRDSVGQIPDLDPCPSQNLIRLHKPLRPPHHVPHLESVPPQHLAPRRRRAETSDADHVPAVADPALPSHR